MGDLVNRLGVRLGRVVADTESDVAQLSPATDNLHLEHHPEATGRGRQVDLEAMRQLGAFGSLGFTEAQLVTRHAFVLEALPRSAGSIRACLARLLQVRIEQSVIEDRRCGRPSVGQALPLAVRREKRPMLGLEGSELLVGCLTSASPLANLLQRSSGFARDDELIRPALLSDDEVALQTTAHFDVKLLLHRRNHRKTFGQGRIMPGARTPPPRPIGNPAPGEAAGVRGDEGVCSGLDLQLIARLRPEIASPAEAAELIAAMRPKDRATLGFAVYAGLRLGELLALDVAAVDLDSGWIHVHRSWDRGTKQFVPTKSRKPRSVPIIDKLAVLLADHFVLLDHPSEGLLFPSTNNPDWPTDAGILRRRTHARWSKAGLKPLGFHEGRHTYASIGIAAGLNPKTLSTYLGHATITITLDRYGHFDARKRVGSSTAPQ